MSNESYESGANKILYLCSSLSMNYDCNKVFKLKLCSECDHWL